MGRFNSLPQWFLRTKSGKEAQAEAETQWAGEREAAATEIPKIQGEYDPLLQASGETLAAARAERQEARQRFRDAETALRRAEQVDMSLRLSRDQQVSALEAELRISSDPLIRDFVDAMRVAWQETTSTSPIMAPRLSTDPISRS